MKREDIYEVIRWEREYQDKTWPHEGRPMGGQYRYAAPHLYLLEEYAAKTRALWVKSYDEVDVLRNLAKMATIAFRALTEIGHGLSVNTYSEECVKNIVANRRDRQDEHDPHTGPDAKEYADMYRFSAPHALLAEDCISMTIDSWCCGNQPDVFERIADTLAVLVRALEEIEGPNLLDIGLR